MGINTPIPLVLVGIWAPDRLIVVDEKGLGLRIQMDQGDCDLVGGVSKGAVVPILTLLDVVRVFVTKFAFIPARMIKLLNFIVCVGACILQLAIIGSLTHYMLVRLAGSPAIHFVMVVQANLDIMGI